MLFGYAFVIDENGIHNTATAINVLAFIFVVPIRTIPFSAIEGFSEDNGVFTLEIDKTKIDLPGEAGTIMHQESKIGPVELATISFGQSFQITPVQLATTVSSLINGGNRVTPHFAKAIQDSETGTVEELKYETLSGICSEDTSKTLRYLLEQVVSDGSGSKAYVKGYEIGGKTATSQTLPRSQNKYISSFIGFAPADDPRVLGMCLIYDPQGIYYGGTIAAPVVGAIFENIFPYLDIEKQ